MEQNTREILSALKNGSLSIDEAELKLKTSPFEDIGYAKVDMHRKLRQGVGEVIYGAGKTADQISGIIRTMLEHGQERILITRLDPEKCSLLTFPDRIIRATDKPETDRNTPKPGTDQTDAVTDTLKRNTDQPQTNESTEAKFPGKIPFHYYESARIGIIGFPSKPDGLGKIVVATGGTSDIPVAEEAALTAEFLGNEVLRLYDVGVAGLHRLLPHIEAIMSANVVIAIAGMEGALASVVGGLADCPVIAVPTSVGYGAAFGGLSALLSMLNSCASGCSVVNIDNGFGAGFIAHRINHPKHSLLPPT